MILFDGEPHAVSNGLRHNLIITTKHERLPSDTPIIYLPEYMAAVPNLRGPKVTHDVMEFCVFAYGNCNEKYDGVKASWRTIINIYYC